MLWCDQKGTRQHTSDTRSADAKIFLRFIIVSLLRRCILLIHYAFWVLSLRPRHELKVCQGYLVDWDAQKAIWDGLFSSEVLSVSDIWPPPPL